MLGAIIGDIAGSRFEWDNLKSKDFELFTYRCHPTDDSNMTLAIAQAILSAMSDWSDLSQAAIMAMQDIGRKYPHGFGHSFRQWVYSDTPQPYNSWGNGAAMRVSSCAWAAKSLDEALMLSPALLSYM